MKIECTEKEKEYLLDNIRKNSGYICWSLDSLDCSGLGCSTCWKNGIE